MPSLRMPTRGRMRGSAKALGIPYHTSDSFRLMSSSISMYCLPRLPTRERTAAVSCGRHQTDSERIKPGSEQSIGVSMMIGRGLGANDCAKKEEKKRQRTLSSRRSPRVPSKICIEIDDSATVARRSLTISTDGTASAVLSHRPPSRLSRRARPLTTWGV